jgi:flagellar biosynthesis chaperone FliJ
MEDPVHVTLNTSASTMSPCVDTSSGPNRLCACETVPVLRTGFPEDLSKHLLCSKKGGEIDTRHRSTTRNAVGSKNRSMASGGVIPDDTIKITTSDGLPSTTEVREESQKLDTIQVQGTISEDKPVALRTRRCRQQTAPIRINDDGGDSFQERNQDKELIRQLKTKIKEQETSINELSSAVESFLKIQPIVKKLQGNLSKISNQVVPQEQFKVTVSKPEIVKPFTPSLEKSEVMTKHQILMKEWRDSAESALKDYSDQCQIYPGDESYDKLCKTFWKNRHKTESKWNRQMDIMMTGIPDKKSQCHDTRTEPMNHSTTSEKKICKHVAFVAKRSRVTSIDNGSPTYYHSASEHNDSEAESSPPKSDQDSSQDDSSDNSGEEPETPPANFRNRREIFKNRRDSPEDSQESDSGSSSSPSIDYKINRYRGNDSKDKSQGYKKGDNIVAPKFPKTKFPKKDRLEAFARITAAFDQVDPAVYRNPKGKRKTATLYVGNLEFNASEQDLRQALDKIFKKVRVENITIPRVNGRSKYGFIEISWAHCVPLKLADLCIKNSGMIQVNSRRIYFRELRNKGNDQ